jgi:hypothetical protein
MPIQLDWGDYDHNFVIMTFRGKWVGDEFLYAITRLSEMSQSKASEIELMVDMRDSQNPPHNLITLLRFTLNRPLPSHITQVIVISNSSFWNHIYSMLEISLGDKIRCPVRFVASVDDAYDSLEFMKREA